MMFQIAPNPNRELRTTTEVGTIYKNIVLDGVKCLHVDKARVTYKVAREYDVERRTSTIYSKSVIDEQIEHMCFNFEEVTPKELMVYRRKKIPSFVLKINGKLYYTKIPRNVSFLGTSLLGCHMCSLQCCRLSPASDEEGGCEKVRNYATFIERYPWITTGYETFGTKVDCFFVSECSNYDKLPSGRVNSSLEKQPEEDEFSGLLKRPF